MTVSSHSKPVCVCFVSPKAYTLFNPAADGVIGGAEVDLYLLATELARDGGFDVSCITADYGQQTEETIENVRVIKSLDFKQNQVTGAIKIWKALKNADADVYMLKTPSPGVPLVAAFCKRFKRNFVYRAASEREFNGVYLSKHPILGRLFIRSLRQAAMITVQNRIDADNFNSLMNLEAVVIPNGHRLPGLANTPKQTILWVGRSAPVKRPDLFLKLAQELPNEKFTMICQRATGDKGYDTLANEANEVPNIEFHESVPFREIDTYFAKAKALINTSDSEGFPNTFIQATKQVTPIISLNVNPDNFMEKYNCGICCYGDVEKMIELIKVFTSTQTDNEMGKNGRRYVEDNHDVTVIVERYKKLFRKLRDSSKGENFGG